MTVWRFRLSEPFYYQHAIFDGVVFENDWAKIEHGEIMIKAGYASGRLLSEMASLWVGHDRDARWHAEI